MIEKKTSIIGDTPERAVLVGLITPQQDEAKSAERKPAI